MSLPSWFDTDTLITSGYDTCISPNTFKRVSKMSTLTYNWMNDVIA